MNNDTFELKAKCREICYELYIHLVWSQGENTRLNIIRLYLHGQFGRGQFHYLKLASRNCRVFIIFPPILWWELQCIWTCTKHTNKWHKECWHYGWFTFTHLNHTICWTHISICCSGHFVLFLRNGCRSEPSNWVSKCRTFVLFLWLGAFRQKFKIQSGTDTREAHNKFKNLWSHFYVHFCQIRVFFCATGILNMYKISTGPLKSIIVKIWLVDFPIYTNIFPDGDL